MKNLFIKFGRLDKIHGVKGSLVLLSDSGQFPKPFPNIVYINKNSFSSFQTTDQKKLMALERLKVKFSEKKGILIDFKNFQNRSEAFKLLGKNVYLPRQVFQSKKGEGIYLSELIGFECFVYGGKKRLKKLGEVDHFLSHSHQDLLVIRDSDGQYLEAPFVSAYIQSIQFKKKQIIFNLPDNFLKLNT